MALGTRGSNPIWAEFSLDGNIFDDTYWMYVLKNTIPYIPADVYHDPDLEVALDNPIQFLGNGTLPADIYFESNVVYRLEFRKNDGLTPPSQNDPLIYEVNNYIAGSGGSTPVDTVAFASSNQITNPQFALINFTAPLVLSSVTNPAPVDIGAGWFLELTGTGSATISRLALNNTNANPSNAPYALDLTLSGWSSVFLRQRFQQNGMLWANKFVSSTVTAQVGPSDLPQNISAILIDSNGATTQVLKLSPVNGEWNELTGYGELGDTTNPNLPPAAYIDYKLALPSNIHIYLTSFQLVVQELPLEPGFEQDSIERQIDHTFHYYKPKLEFKPTPSYLVGWDFPLNPAQFGVSGSVGAIGANKSAYVWDQTIVYQSASNSITYNQNINGDLVFTTIGDTRLAIIQYLSLETVRELLARNMSVSATLSSLATPTVTISLWYTTNTTLPSVIAGSNLSLVNTLDANGHPDSVVSGWTEVVRKGGNATFTCPSTVDNLNEATVGFSGWDGLLLSVASTAKFFAIVVGTSTIVSGKNIEFNQVSLVPGDIPTITPPKTLDETLRECQYYYEKSYGLGIYGGASGPAAAANQIVSPMGYAVASGPTYGTIPLTFGQQFNSLKITAPVISFYSISGTLNNVSVYTNFNGTVTGPVDAPLATYWNNVIVGPRAFTRTVTYNNLYLPTGLGAVTSYIAYNFIADSRLGTF